MEVSALRGLPRTAAGNLICRGAQKETVHPPLMLTPGTWHGGSLCGKAERAVRHLSQLVRLFMIQKGKESGNCVLKARGKSPSRVLWLGYLLEEVGHLL